MTKMHADYLIVTVTKVEKFQFQGSRCVALLRNVLPSGSTAANVCLTAEPSAFCVTRRSHVTSL